MGKRFLSTLSFCTFFALVFFCTNDAFAQATSFDIYGYRANEGGGGALDVKWTKGNLGNTWAEGEWVAYKLVLSNVQTNYPNFAGLPDLRLSFDFTNKGNRFIDLIRGIQVSTSDLNDSEGWPNDAGAALPLTTRGEIEEAQNDIGNAGDLENVWSAFDLLRTAAPVSFGSQISSLVNRDLAGNDGTPADERHTFTVPVASLLEAGIPATANTIVVYFQLHESRSFIWFNSLQSGYDQFPSDDWGGYLYSIAAYAADSRPIPIPERLPGAVSGLKWHDEDGNGLIDGSEQTLSGWRIHVFGSLEGIDFETNTLTDEFGNYSFPNLTSNVIWEIREDAQRFDPAVTGWMQSYPLNGTVVGVGTGVDFGVVDGLAAAGWNVALTIDVQEQGDMNFGNYLCELAITCPPDATVDCNLSTAPSNTGFPTVVSNCTPGEPSYTDVVTEGDCDIDGYLYQIERTWTVTDDVGNTETCVQIITVVDTTPPVITGVGADGSIECPAEPVFSEPTASDDCSIPTLTFNDVVTPGDCPQEYSVTRTWTATDDCGNTSTASQTIEVFDNTPPVISGVGADGSIECPAEPVFSDPTATDACGPASLTFADVVTPGDCPQEYSVTRTWTATDDCGNTSTASQTIDVFDNTPPVISGVGDDHSVECPGEPVFSEPTATDACGPASLTFADVDTPGDCPQEYSVTRTWTATDDCGNSSTASQTINVVDTTPPEITCPDDATYECDNVGEFGMATAIDACDPDPAIDFSDVVLNETCPLQIQRTWTATDACGNSSSCMQQIIINDLSPPVISGVGADGFVECPAEPVFSDPTATDACDENPSLTFEDVVTPGDCPQEYSVTRTWTATDWCENSSTASQTINVVDNTPPVISGVGDDGSVECPAEPVFSDPTATDACDENPSLAFEDVVTPGDCPQEYSVTRTWTATDDCGNSSTASQTINVVDNTPPVISGVGDGGTIECPGEPTFSEPTATDACGPCCYPG
jgi:hypothetical protein